jgi:positive regulator of sigma E activity
MLAALAVVALLGAGVAWALARFAREIARYSEWDEPIVRQKRKGWR